MHEPVDRIRATFRDLRNRHPAHAVAHEYDRTGLLVESATHSVDVSLGRDVVYWRRVGPVCRTVERHDGVAALLEHRCDLVPVPRAVIGTVDEDEPRRIGRLGR